MINPEQFNELRKGKNPMSAHGFLGLLLVLVILIAGLLLIKSSYFTVGSVVVVGNNYVSSEDVQRIADIPQSSNIFSVNTGNVKIRLLHDLRIAEADVSRQFPGTIIINIKERKPVAYVASNYGFLELDQQGVVLAAFKNIKQMNVPLVTGIRLENEYVGDQIENVTVKSILEYLGLLDESALNQLSEVNLKSPEQIIAYTINSAHIRLGNSERLSDKAKLTNDILHELNDKKMIVEYIDFNYASPFIKPKQ